MGYTELSNSKDDDSTSSQPSRWQENNGNLLLGFVGIIVAFGASIIACRQSRILPPSFPRNLVTQDREAAEAEFLAQASDENRQVVTVRVIGAASDDGKMRLAVYASPTGFNDPLQALGTDTWEIRGGVCEGRFGLPAEVTEIAIAAYHDVNNNEKLDRNAIGIPSERYGFTRDARGVTGPPSFDDAVIAVSDEPVQISIR
ncbi:MAG TPA: hypothetical protein DDZ51_25385 [Planctomycetaceae bacterium]|nr:hypothetical protein [Planctomycetaceae bacterium]